MRSDCEHPSNTGDRVKGVLFAGRAQALCIVHIEIVIACKDRASGISIRLVSHPTV